MSDTPRTDAVDNRVKEVHASFFEMRSHAWRLERELSAMTAERDELVSTLEKCKINAESIQKIKWGYDGCCGANRLAEFIEEDCQLAIDAVKGGKP